MSILKTQSLNGISKTYSLTTSLLMTCSSTAFHQLRCHTHNLDLVIFNQNCYFIFFHFLHITFHALSLSTLVLPLSQFLYLFEMSNPLTLPLFHYHFFSSCFVSSEAVYSPQSSTEIPHLQNSRPSISTGCLNPRMRNPQRANCTMPLYIRNLSIHRFWYPRGSWNQSQPPHGYQRTTVPLNSFTSLLP